MLGLFFLAELAALVQCSFFFFKRRGKDKLRTNAASSAKKNRPKVNIVWKKVEGDFWNFCAYKA